MKKSLFAVIITLALFNTQCQKETVNEDEAVPVADFTANQSEYKAGETILLTNQSTNGDHFRWTLPNGTTSRDKDLNYAIDINSTGGSVSFKLEAISKSGIKSDYSVKSFSVRPATGNLVLYSTINVYSFDVSIDGQVATTVNISQRNSADCSTPGTYKKELSTGLHSVSYTYYNFGTYITRTQTLTITPNQCYTLGLN